MHLRRVLLATLAMAAVSAPVDAQWLNYPTPGIPRLADGRPALSSPVPRTADGRPDLSGVWFADCSTLDACWGQSLFFDLARDLKSGDVEMTAWAAAVQAQRERRRSVDDPLGHCLPPGVPRIDFVFPFKVLSTPAVTALLYEEHPGMVSRQAFTDGRPLPTVTQPAWLGYSVGRWEADTFVVETTGFRDGGWLDTRKARPHSDALHVTERFRRLDLGRMELTVTINDPKAYVKPWTVRAMVYLLPDTELLEAFCENQDKTMEHRRIDPPPPEPPSPSLR